MRRGGWEGYSTRMNGMNEDGRSLRGGRSALPLILPTYTNRANH
jgi:hypothetical protein